MFCYNFNSISGFFEFFSCAFTSDKVCVDSVEFVVRMTNPPSRASVETKLKLGLKVETSMVGVNDDRQSDTLRVR